MHRVRSAADSEQPFRIDEVHEDGDVHHERADAEHAHTIEQLVDLERQEPSRGHHGEVLGPPALAPQPDGLDAFDDAVGRRRDRQRRDRALAEIGDAMQLAAQHVVAGVRSGVAGDAIETVGRVSRKRLQVEQPRVDDRKCNGQQPEDDGVESPVDGDQSKDDRVVQRLPASGQIELLERRDDLRRHVRRFGREAFCPRVAAQAPRVATTVLRIEAQLAIVGPQRGDGCRGRDVAAHRAHQRLDVPVPWPQPHGGEPFRSAGSPDAQSLTFAFNFEPL